MPQEHEYSNDPKAYELTVTLHEGEELLYEAELGLPDGFKIPESKPAVGFAPVALVAKRVNSKLKGVPAAPRGSADTAIAAVKLAWDFIKEGAPKASAEGASTAVLGTDDMAWDHYAAAQKFASKTYHYRVKNGFGFECVIVDYVARGTFRAQYDGKKDVREGDYMPNVEVYCSKVDLGWGWNLDAKAVLSHLSNVGPKGGKVIPDFNTTLAFNFWTIICNRTNTYSYELRGDQGFVGNI